MLPNWNFFSKIERNISFPGACFQNGKYLLLKLKIYSCSKKIDFSFGSTLPPWKSCGPELKMLYFRKLPPVWKFSISKALFYESIVK